MAVTFALATNDTNPPWPGSADYFTMENEVDLGVDASTAVSTDIIEALAIPANTEVLQVRVKITEALAGAAVMTCTTGYGGAANCFDASANLAAAVGTIYYGLGGTDAGVTNGVPFATADTIDLVLTITGTPITAGKFKVKAWCRSLA